MPVKRTRKAADSVRKFDQSNIRIDKLRASLPSTCLCEPLEQRQLLSVSASTLFGAVLVAGNTWNYTDTVGNVTTNFTQTVVGPATYNGAAGTEVDTTFSASTEKDYYGYDDDGDIVTYGGVITGGNRTETTTYDPYEVGIPATLSGTTTYTSSNTETDVVDNSSGNSTTTSDDTVQISLVSATPVSVTVPAGTFTNAYELQSTTTYVDTDGSGNSTDTSMTWFVPGIGLVKSYDASDDDTIVLNSTNTGGDTLDFTGQPTETMAGDSITPAVTVTAENSSGDPDTDATGNITVTLTGEDSGNATLSGFTSEPLVNGVATFSGLSVDNPGTYNLTASDDGTPAASDTTSDSFDVDGIPVTAPATPTGLAATQGTLPKHVEVTWNTVTGATSYQVFRGTSPDSLSKIAAGLTTPAYADATAAPGVDYYYSVRAVNAAGVSDLATPVTGYLPLAAPTNLAATDTLPKHIAVTWDAVPNAASYQVFRGTTASNEVKIAAGVTTPSYADTTAVQGTIYDYSVRAVNSVGIGLTAGPVTGFKCLPAPTDLTATDDLSNEVTISWDAVAGADTYQVFRGTTDDFNVATNISGTVSGLTFNDTTAASDQLYYYWVRARIPGDIGADDGPSTGEKV